MSTSLEELIRLWPLEKFDAEEMLRAGELEMLALRYRKRAADEQTRGEWWAVWLEIQKRRGLELRTAVDELTDGRRRYLAQWLFGRGRVDEGMRVCEVDGALPDDYLEALVARGRLDDAMAALDRAGGPHPLVARALARSGRAEEALRWWAPHQETWHWEGGVWAVAALLEAAAGHEARAHASMLEAAKRGGGDEETITDLLARLKVSPRVWQGMLQQYRYLPEDHEGTITVFGQNT
jgi:hypothetical protein